MILNKTDFRIVSFPTHAKRADDQMKKFARFLSNEGGAIRGVHSEKVLDASLIRSTYNHFVFTYWITSTQCFTTDYEKDVYVSTLLANDLILVVFRWVERERVLLASVSLFCATLSPLALLVHAQWLLTRMFMNLQ